VRERPLGRRLSWADAVDVLTKHDHDPRAHEATELAAPAGVKRSTLLIAAVAVAALLVGIAYRYHPPIAVVAAAKPIDVVQDITITGVDVAPPTGKYLLTSVQVRRPNLAGLVIDKIRGRTLVSVDESDPSFDVSYERRLAREAFLNSHKHAIALAEKTLDVDPKGITIVIRDRKISGPSAGLTYALAIMDMLDPADLAAGRVIAATGELTSRGRIGAVAFVSLKIDVARKGGAHVFLVPAKQAKEVGAEDVTVIGVKDFEAAVRALKRVG
jgi:PDZ domain-containing protein